MLTNILYGKSFLLFSNRLESLIQAASSEGRGKKVGKVGKK